MRISFNSIPVGVPSKLTKRIYSREVLQSIAEQINTADQELLIINHVGERRDLDYSRACGSVIKGSAAIVDNILQMQARFYNKDFFLAHPYEFKPEMKDIDPTRGNMMEKLTMLDAIDYSPIGDGEVDQSYHVTNYKILYIYGQPKGLS
jgi:hypothetical protein